MRLNLYLARCGVASRRRAEKEYILKGKVKVNGEVVLNPAYHVSEDDIVEINGRRVEPIGESVWIAFYKPRAVLTTTRNQRIGSILDKRKNVMDYFKNFQTRVFPVGRLDYNTEGLLLFTNDGDMAQKLLKPHFGIEKEYWVWTDLKKKYRGKGLVSKVLERLKCGMRLKDDRGEYLFKPCRVELVKDGDNWVFKLVITLGRNRVIRRAFAALGVKIKKLLRVRIGNIELGKMLPGEWRYLTEKEVEQLKKLINKAITTPPLN